MVPAPPTTTPPAGDDSTNTAGAPVSSTVSTVSATPLRGNTTTTNPHLKRQHASTTKTSKASTKTATTNASGASGTLQIKKRPYRRTKRPKNYCDKSTVTTVTTPTRQPGDDASRGTGDSDGSNVYDAVLGECEDLLRASTEAQRLGRLKMASAYQLLLHTRLVGLGKRFDRSAMMVDQQKARQQLQEQKQRAAQKQLNLDPSASQEAAGGASTDAALGKVEAGTSDSGKEGETSESGTVSKPAGVPVPAALQQLRSILPGNLEMDASMMEHLARAAVELHHQRTGRKKSADGLLASPIDGGLVTSSPAVATTDPPTTEDTTKPTAATASTKKSSVAWTPSETAIVVKALKEGKDNYTIATTLLPNKTVVQVHAFVKNQLQLHKVNKLQQQQQQQQQQQAGKGTLAIAGTASNTAAGSGSASAAPSGKTESQDPSSATTGANNPATAAAGAKGGTPAAPRRGGRGRKPPTTAMNTVPNVTMDVRALLRKANQKKKTATITAAAVTSGATATTSTASTSAPDSNTPPTSDKT